MGGRRGRRRVGPVTRWAATASVLALVATGCTTGDDPARSTPSPSRTGPSTITFSVYGAAPVVAAYRRIAAQFTADNPDTVVKVTTYRSRAEASTALQRAFEKGTAPDLFEIDGDDLSGLVADKRVRRVDELLIERRVDFGDSISRSALEAFSLDSALQCMPTDFSPLVVYYNTRLIDLSLAAQPDARPVTQDSGWTLEEFRRVATLARQPGVRGLYIAPDLRQLAPFVWSGGGDVVDDPDDPTTLALSEDSSATALQQVLNLVRDPAITFDAAALRTRSPIDRFKAGKLGMLLGYRDLMPVLRQQKGLNFDVMPLPRPGSATTVASMRGICIAAGSDNEGKAADFLRYAVSTRSAEQLAATGYAMPTNLEALNSESFLQRGQRPLHGGVFQREMRHVEELPRTRYWGDVVAASAPLLYRLFYDPVIDPVQDRLTAIDELSRPILGQDESPSPSPSPTGSTGATP